MQRRAVIEISIIRDANVKFQIYLLAQRKGWTKKQRHEKEKWSELYHEVKEKMIYYCTYCESELEPEEALREQPPHFDPYHGDDPPYYEIRDCCPRCGSVNCIEERVK